MLTSILVFIAVLSVLILAHELGHFYAAKRAGVLVEEFGFGLPPRVIGKKVGETIYSLNLLPIGGFVKLHGENKEEEIEKPERAFLNKGALTKSIIVTAGVFMNLLLGLFAFIAVHGFTKPVETGEVIVVAIAENSPAQEAGMMKGDVVTKIDGEEINTSRELIRVVDEKKGGRATITLLRDTKELRLEVVPRENPPEKEGSLGIAIASQKDVFVFPPPNFGQIPRGIYLGFIEALKWGGRVAGGLVLMLLGIIGGELPQGIVGPAGIFAMTDEIRRQGAVSTVRFLGIISVNLAILNIIPFPPLDGARLLFIGIEKFLGRRVVPKVESVIHTIGFALLILLIISITVREVRLISEFGLSGYVDYLSEIPM